MTSTSYRARTRHEHPRIARRRRAAIAAAVLGAGLTFLFAPGAGPARAALGPSRAAREAPGGWVTLFDGSGLASWRGYKRSTVPGVWHVEGQTLAVRPTADSSQRGDLVTREQFGDFEFAYEWRVSPGGNSGVIYRADETHDYVWQTGPEMQVLDDRRHPDGRTALTRAGSDYGVYAPAAAASRAAGEWNAARIVARGPHVEHWLNGRRVVSYEQGSADWKRRVAASKFRSVADYGTLRRGHIALQDHGDSVWFRNVRVRPLPAPAGK